MSEELKRLRDQLTRIQTALYDTRPKQAVGEMVEHAITLANRIEAQAGEAVATVVIAHRGVGASLGASFMSLTEHGCATLLIGKHALYTHPPIGDAAGKDSVDAARYRWLRERDNSLETRQRDIGVVNGPSCYHEVEGIRELKWGDDLDASIDAAAIASLTKPATGDKP